MQSAFFVSDVHITAADDPRTLLFQSFLQTLCSRDGTTHLFLMGDIFDLWLADHRHFVSKYQPIIDELARLRDEGIEVHYFEGNHDLHLKYFWADKLGLKVHSDPTYIRLGERTLRLEHGDQMDPDDRGYRFLRWFLRTPPMRYLICHLPESLVVWLGERASSTSRSYTSNLKTISDDGAIDKIRTHATVAYTLKPYDLLISGHVHIRDDHIFKDGQRDYRSVNLGTWLDAPCYFKIDSNEARLYEVPQEQPSAVHQSS